jgi:hypothetical protein
MGVRDVLVMVPSSTSLPAGGAEGGGDRTRAELDVVMLSSNPADRGASNTRGAVSVLSTDTLLVLARERIQQRSIHIVVATQVKREGISICAKKTWGGITSMASSATSIF